MPGIPRLSVEQANAAAAIAVSGRRVDLLVGPAGAGKTRALCALRAVWEDAHGAGSVVGLAPSAAAAAELAASLGINADTLAKWIHQTSHDTASGEPWRLRAGQLVIVDEAAMASTAHLDALLAQASGAGAKIVLVGDHAQLGAIDAGGAFALLVEEANAVELEQLHRFSEDWEAAATRRLRVGDPAALDAYATYGRLHEGPVEAVIERAYRAWATDTAAGLDALLLAPDRDTVTALNARARADQIRTGQVDPTIEVVLHDATAAGAGDHVVTRRNNRRLTRPDGAHVRNGDRWVVRAVHADGSLDAVPRRRTGREDRQGVAVRLPADYVRDHVELAYASTVHRAQGATADTTHLLARAGMSREALYVGLTRGRRANHAYTATDLGGSESHLADVAPTGRQILEAILRSPTAETSATSALRRRQPEQLRALTHVGQWPPRPAAETPRPRPSPAAYRPPPTPGMTR
jgi:ATP-dependent exoDNAse (exonuclease V) alpha subunit